MRRRYPAIIPALVVKVRGSALQARLRYLGDRADAAARESIFAALQPATRAIFEKPIDVTAWYPFEAFVDVNVVMDRLLGIGDLQLCYDVGRYAAQLNLPAFYRAILSLGSVPFVLRRAAGMWSDHYDSGTLDVTETEGRVLTMRILGFETPHRAHCRAVAGWAAQVVEMVGAKTGPPLERVCESMGGPWCEWAIRYA